MGAFKLIYPERERFLGREKLRFKFIQDKKEIENKKLFIKAYLPNAEKYYQFQVSNLQNDHSFDFEIDKKSDIRLAPIAGILEKTDKGYFLIGMIIYFGQDKKGTMYWFNNTLREEFESELGSLGNNKKESRISIDALKLPIHPHFAIDNRENLRFKNENEDPVASKNIHISQNVNLYKLEGHFNKKNIINRYRVSKPSTFSGKNLFFYNQEGLKSDFSIENIPDQSAYEVQDELAEKLEKESGKGVFIKLDNRDYLVGTIKLRKYNLSGSFTHTDMGPPIVQLEKKNKGVEIHWLSQKINDKIDQIIAQDLLKQKSSKEKIEPFESYKVIPISPQFSLSTRKTLDSPAKILTQIKSLNLFTHRARFNSYYKRLRISDFSQMSHKQVTIKTPAGKEYPIKLGIANNQAQHSIKTLQKDIVPGSPVLIKEESEYYLAGFIQGKKADSATIKWLDIDTNQVLDSVIAKNLLDSNVKLYESTAQAKTLKKAKWAVYIYSNFFSLDTKDGYGYREQTLEQMFSEDPKALYKYKNKIKIRGFSSRYQDFTRWWNHTDDFLSKNPNESKVDLSVAFHFNSYNDYSTKPQQKRGWAKIHGKVRDFYAGADVHGAGSSPNTFKDFLDFAFKNCPAEKVAVIYIGHGGTWMGISSEPKKLIPSLGSMSSVKLLERER